MPLSHIPQCTIQNRNVHISVLNGVLWDMGQVHFGIGLMHEGHTGLDFDTNMAVIYITLWYMTKLTRLCACAWVRADPVYEALYMWYN